MPVIVTAVFSPAPGRKEDLVDALRRRMPAVHAEEGCLLYAIHDASDGTVTMIEKWETAEFLSAHASGPAVAALDADVAPHLAAPTTVTTMTPLAAGDERKGNL